MTSRLVSPFSDINQSIILLILKLFNKKYGIKKHCKNVIQIGNEKIIGNFCFIFLASSLSKQVLSDIDVKISIYINAHIRISLIVNYTHLYLLRSVYLFLFSLSRKQVIMVLRNRIRLTVFHLYRFHV